MEHRLRADGNETETRRTNPRDAISSLTVAFDAPSFGPDALQEFKRVNAIDQSGREGKGVAETSASVTGARWEQVWLLRKEGRVPFTARRFTDMRCPAAAHFVVEQGPHLDDGGEAISIFGNPDSIPKESEP